MRVLPMVAMGCSDLSPRYLLRSFKLPGSSRTMELWGLRLAQRWGCSVEDCFVSQGKIAPPGQEGRARSAGVVVQKFLSNLNNHPVCADNGCFAVFSSLAQPPLLSRRGNTCVSDRYRIALTHNGASRLLILAGV